MFEQKSDMDKDTLTRFDVNRNDTHFHSRWECGFSAVSICVSPPAHFALRVNVLEWARRLAAVITIK